jgi:Phage integrase family
MATDQLTGAEPDRLVFTTPQGQPLDYSHWRIRTWLRATDKAGLDGAGFHDLRRANATILVAEGIDVKTAQTRLGHADPTKMAPDLVGKAGFEPAASASRTPSGRTLVNWVEPKVLVRRGEGLGGRV